MKKLLLIPLLLATFFVTYGQETNETGGIYNDTTIIIPDSVSLVRDTSVVTFKSMKYHQERVEAFTELDFDTLYMIQYAIVTEVRSMPQNSVAVPFLTNEVIMNLIISDRYYTKYEEAVAIGERVRVTNRAFEYYMIKPCLVPRTSPLVANKTEEQTGHYKIQYTWTATYPFDILEGFEVETYDGGFRQISKQAYETKEEAITWLTEKQHKLAEFWVYPLDDNPPLDEKSATGEKDPKIKDQNK